MSEDDVQRAFTVGQRAFHEAARAFAMENIGGRALSGVLCALELVPAHRVPIVKASSASPWIEVDQVPGPVYAVWRETGAVYEVGPDGAVGEEPVA